MTINANKSNNFRVTVRVCLLVFLWILGLALGYLLSKPCYIPLMRSALLQPVSIVGFIVCIFLPLILTSLSICLEKPILILIVCFIKSAAYGFSCGLISLIFCSASWLVRFLFLFSDSCFLLVLLSIWIKAFSDTKKIRFRSLQYAAVIAVLIGIADYCVVSPLIERLL